MLIGMELVKETVETVLLTGRLRKHSPKSLLLISEPEQGKTRIFFETPCQSVIMLTDVTGRAIQELCRQQADKTHFIINDLVAVLSHKQTVNKYTLSMINAITEEGIAAVAFPGQTETFKNGKRGIVAALTTTMTKDGRAWWNKIGLTTRMIPFCYAHSDELIVKIKTAIDGDSSEIGGKEFKIPQLPLNVEMPSKITNAVRSLADRKAKELGEVGYRRLDQFRALCRAHALRRGQWKSCVATMEDVDFLKRIFPYMNYTKACIL